MTERSFFWRRHLEAIVAEGITTAAYARREGLSLGLLYQWRRKLNPAPASLSTPRRDPAPGFVALRVTESLHALPKEWTLRFQGMELSFPERPDPLWVADLCRSLTGGERYASGS